MKYWMDTEFIAAPYSIDLISVGLVAEDGREFYAESSEVDWSKASLWTLKNVRPQLNGEGISREAIGYAVRRFTDGDEHPVFWGYFPAYDWVAFSWLFGHMDELPFHYLHGRFSPASIPPPANGAQSAARTPRAQARADFFRTQIVSD